jgi:hypothetical protein
MKSRFTLRHVGHTPARLGRRRQLSLFGPRPLTRRIRRQELQRAIHAVMVRRTND